MLTYLERLLRFMDDTKRKGMKVMLYRCSDLKSCGVFSPFAVYILPEGKTGENGEFKDDPYFERFFNRMVDSFYDGNFVEKTGYDKLDRKPVAVFESKDGKQYFVQRKLYTVAYREVDLWHECKGIIYGYEKSKDGSPVYRPVCAICEVVKRDNG